MDDVDREGEIEIPSATQRSPVVMRVGCAGVLLARSRYQLPRHIDAVQLPEAAQQRVRLAGPASDIKGTQQLLRVAELARSLHQAWSRLW